MATKRYLITLDENQAIEIEKRIKKYGTKMSGLVSEVLSDWLVNQRELEAIIEEAKKITAEKKAMEINDKKIEVKQRT